MSLRARNKQVHGVGINDADYVVHRKHDFGQDFCQIYQKWSSMICRCYSKKFQATNQAYSGCSVSSEWLVFSNFKRWMEQQDWLGKHLDKDLLVYGNKVYSEERCVFLDPIVNGFISAERRHDKGLLIGARWFSRDSNYSSACRNPFTGKNEHLGYFNSEIEAHLAWKTRKMQIALILADTISDKVIAEALRNRYL